MFMFDLIMHSWNKYKFLLFKGALKSFLINTKFYIYLTLALCSPLLILKPIKVSEINFKKFKLNFDYRLLYYPIGCV